MAREDVGLYRHNRRDSGIGLLIYLHEAGSAELLGILWHTWFTESGTAQDTLLYTCSLSVFLMFTSNSHRFAAIHDHNRRQTDDRQPGLRQYRPMVCWS